MAEFIEVARLDQLSLGRGTVVTIAEKDVALFNVDGTGERRTELIETIHQLIEWAVLGIEILAVAVIVAAVLMISVSRGTVHYLFKLGQQSA